MNSFQRIWTIMFVLFIHETNYIILQSFTMSFFYSILLSPFYLLSSSFYNTTTNYLRSGSMISLSSSCLQPILSGLSGYLPCHIKITISYCQIRANTLYLQLLTVLYDFTNMTYLKMLFPKYLNNSIYF
jgi:hypothetical protein